MFYTINTMKQKKIKLTAEDILQFYSEKPSFDRSETDASIKYGWPSTKDGLYSITDFYRYFEAKGYTKNDVDDIIFKSFQKHDYFASKPKMEKGKTHCLKIISVTNFSPDYKQGNRYMSSSYYFVDISNEKAIELKKEYEADSQKHMQALTERYNSLKKSVTKSASQKARDEKQKPKKTRVKKIPQVEVLVA